MTFANQVPNWRRRALLAALSLGGMGAPLAKVRAATPEDAWQSAFAPFDGPMGRRFDGQLSCPALPVEGELPPGLNGVLYRNGPARMRLGPTRYHHWFDGDGMVQEFTIGGARIAHRGVLLRTPKLLAEEAAGRFLYPSFGTALTDGLPVRRPDAINVANINMLSMNRGRDLYALWEGGSAVTLDPASLAVTGFKDWSPQTKGAPFCAHPRREPDGSVWAFGAVAGSGRLILYRLGVTGALVQQAVLEMAQADMVHDFAITEHYLVFLLMPLAWQAGGPPGASYASHFRWNSGAPLIVALVEKADLSVRRYELPTDGLFHIGNAWEEKGLVRLGYVSQPAIRAMVQERALGAPFDNDPRAATRWKEIELDPRGTAARVLASGLLHVEFPAFDTRRTGRKTERTVLLQRSQGMPGLIDGHDTVLALTPRGATRFCYGAGWIAEEHVFVPDRPVRAA